MIRFIVVVILCCLFRGVFAQETEIHKSADVIVLRGKSYYLHTVQAGQTLYSICKAYGVGTEEVRALNDKKDDALSLYEVLKIPFAETFVQQDDKYYYHRVEKGETLYSIARLYEIKPKRLLKYNGEYAHNEPLSVGAVVRLPLNEIDLAAVRSRANEISRPEDSVEEGLMAGKDIKDGLAEIGAKNADVPVVRDTLPVGNYGETAEEDSRIIPDHMPDADPFVKIAVLLPFSAREYPHYIDTLRSKYQTVTLSARSEQFIGFYEGILLAVDSLRKRGYKIGLHVYDTERSSDKVGMLAGEIDRLKPDLIIGPVYGSVYKTFVNSLSNKHIPVVYPLSSRTENFGDYPNFVQVHSTFEVLAEEMSSWLKEQQAFSNIVYLNLKGGGGENVNGKAGFRDQLRETGKVKFFNWVVDGMPLDSLRRLLLPDRENILVLPETKEADVSKILPLLSALTDSYPITVLGLPEWQAFTSVDHETYYKLNTKLFTYSYVDYASEPVRDFSENYRKYFHTEPGTLAYKAFDMGIYFIELAAKYRDRTLEALEFADQKTGSSSFRFRKMRNGVGKENFGMFIVNYSKYYQLEIESWR